MNLIIGNILLSIILIITFIKYWRYKRYATTQIKLKDQEIAKEQEKCEEFIKKLQESNLELINNKRNSSRVSNNILNKDKNNSRQEDIKALIEEIDILRQEKEEEMKLRLEAEKQIELALQKTQEIQKRMEDWKMVQDASMRDSKGVIIEVVNELYQKLNKIYKLHNQEEEEMIMEEKELMDHNMKDIYEFLEKISKKVENVEKTSLTIAKDTQNKCFIPLNEIKPKENNKTTNTNSSNQTTISDIKKLTINFEQHLKRSGYFANQDYLFAKDEDQEKQHLIADCIFFKENNLYILDFKAQRYLEEFRKIADENKKLEAKEIMRQKIDKYLTYLSNPKYKNSILEIARKYKADFEKVNIISVVLSLKEIKLLKEIDYFEKFVKYNLEVMDLEKAENLISS
jgi:hypothetical protein